jgi:hypothetical protein
VHLNRDWARLLVTESDERFAADVRAMLRIGSGIWTIDLRSWLRQDVPMRSMFTVGGGGRI